MIESIPDEKIVSNGPMLHPYLKEMNKANLLGDKDLLTVGEAWEQIQKSAGSVIRNPEGQELSMVFQFEHICLQYREAARNELRLAVPSCHGMMHLVKHPHPD